MLWCSSKSIPGQGPCPKCSSAIAVGLPSVQGKDSASVPCANHCFWHVATIRVVESILMGEYLGKLRCMTKNRPVFNVSKDALRGSCAACFHLFIFIDKAPCRVFWILHPLRRGSVTPNTAPAVQSCPCSSACASNPVLAHPHVRAGDALRRKSNGGGQRTGMPTGDLTMKDKG